ncbi:hypothetical protein FGO68_gene2006 [Halteria grandinella]|uniref:Uncharacterized protein n=1 Tax=Halteria grandinella TaxID=5974 RepID=A0A8J8NQ36_HALGN|nr:hypothetical protein FGO68_gene2006 [Halteria grandinella]
MLLRAGPATLQSIFSSKSDPTKISQHRPVLAQRQREVTWLPLSSEGEGIIRSRIISTPWRMSKFLNKKMHGSTFIVQGRLGTTHFSNTEIRLWRHVALKRQNGRQECMSAANSSYERVSSQHQLSHLLQQYSLPFCATSV